MMFLYPALVFKNRPILQPPMTIPVIPLSVATLLLSHQWICKQLSLPKNKKREKILMKPVYIEKGIFLSFQNRGIITSLKH
jgi:hypothetical protein